MKIRNFVFSHCFYKRSLEGGAPTHDKMHKKYKRFFSVVLFILWERYMQYIALYTAWHCYGKYSSCWALKTNSFDFPTKNGKHATMVMHHGLDGIKGSSCWISGTLTNMRLNSGKNWKKTILSVVLYHSSSSYESTDLWLMYVCIWSVLHYGFAPIKSFHIKLLGFFVN